VRIGSGNPSSPPQILYFICGGRRLTVWATAESSGFLNFIDFLANKRHTRHQQMCPAGAYRVELILLTTTLRNYVNIHVRFEVFTAMIMKNGVFWDVTPCGSCKNRPFGET
jgi:hypothetical protein